MIEYKIRTVKQLSCAGNEFITTSQVDKIEREPHDIHGDRGKKENVIHFEATLRNDRADSPIAGIHLVVEENQATGEREMIPYIIPRDKRHFEVEEALRPSIYSDGYSHRIHHRDLPDHLHYLKEELGIRRPEEINYGILHEPKKLFESLEQKGWLSKALHMRIQALVRLIDTGLITLPLEEQAATLRQPAAIRTTRVNSSQIGA